MTESLDLDEIVIVGIFFGNQKTTRHPAVRRPQFRQAEAHMLAAQAVMCGYDWAEAWNGDGDKRLARVVDPVLRQRQRARV